jgi:hypothetical protein
MPKRDREQKKNDRPSEPKGQTVERTQKVTNILLAAFTGLLVIVGLVQYCALQNANQLARLVNAADVELEQPLVTPLGNGAAVFNLTFKNAGHTVAKNLRVQLTLLSNVGELASPDLDPRIATAEMGKHGQPQPVVGIVRLGSGESASYQIKQDVTFTGGSGKFTLFVFGEYSYYDEMLVENTQTPVCLRYDSDSGLKSCLRLEPTK